MLTMSAPDLIVSTAHEVMEALPIWGGQFVCIRCQKRGTLKQMFSDEPSELCRPHYELATSGWTHDERYERITLGADGLAQKDGGER